MSAREWPNVGGRGKVRFAAQMPVRTIIRS
jgi:hypothetical protein